MNKMLKAMSDYTVVSRYARYIPEEKRRATWKEQLDIVKDMHVEKYAEKIDNNPTLKEHIDWAFEEVYEKRLLGSQRALQFGGSPILKKNARIYNCTVSYIDRPEFFQEAFWLLLCGCGVGFSVQKHHVAKLPKIKKRTDEEITYVIPDSIEGWADSLGVLLSSYFVDSQPFPEYAGKRVNFDFSKIRPRGSSLAAGVGKAPGPEGLMNALDKIEILLNSIIGNQDHFVSLKPINTYDIVMHASDAVLSGGVRRSATICLFSYDDEDMAKAKTGNWKESNPQRGRSNNSAILIRNEVTFDQFNDLIGNVKDFGEPGFVWSDNKEFLVNPCAEIGFMAYETFDDGNGGIKRHENGEPVTGRSGWAFCNLCEINGGKIKTREDFEKASRAAAIIGTLQAGYTDFDYLGPVTKSIVEREALLGVSITGMMENPDLIFDEQVQRDMSKIVLDVNEEIAEMIGINPAARATCVKPAGSTSLVLSTSSGIHPHHAKRYFRRIQANKDEAPLKWYKDQNPLSVEESVWSENNTDDVITFCVEVEKGAKIKNQIDAISLLEHVRSTQKNWVEHGMRPERCIAPWLRHNVSNTIHIRDDEWDAVAEHIYEHRDSFAGISLLSLHGDKDYQQAPNCTVYMEQEIIREYGAGAIMASGLIVAGLDCFKDNLWNACDAVLGRGEPLFISKLRDAILENNNPDKYVGISAGDSDYELEGYLQEHVEYLEEKRDWIRRARQFAGRYFHRVNDKIVPVENGSLDDSVIRRMTHCLKDVHNLKLWHDLSREFKPVNYLDLKEETDETKMEESIACAGGKCEVNFM